MARRLAVWLVSLALLAGSLALYARSVGFGWIGYDDTKIVLENPNLYVQGTVGDSLREIFYGYLLREEPLMVRDLTWLFDARVFGFVNPAGYHLGNVVGNAIVVVLLFLFLLHATRRLVFAALTAAVFASLAVHVEPVCWIMGRKDVLSACLVLAALLVQSVELRATGRRRWWLGALVFLLYPLAVLAKFSAIFLPLILVAHRLLAPYLDGSRPPREPLVWPPWPRLLAGWLPHALVGGALYVWYQRTLAAFGIIGHSPGALSATHLKNLAWLVPVSLEKTLLRTFVASEHSISYLRPDVSLAEPTAGIVGAVALVAALLALTGALLRWRKDLAFFPLAFFGFMLPYFNFEYVGIWAADRYAYLSSFCVVVLLVAPLLAGLRSARAPVRRLAVGGLALLFTFAVYQVAAGWRHQAAFAGREELWTYEKSLPHPSLLAFENHGKTMLLKAERAGGDPNLRRQLLEKAVASARAGLAYYQSLSWRAVPGYINSPPVHVAALFEVLAGATELAGGSLDKQIELRRAALGVSAGDLQRQALARTLLAAALRDPRAPALARESLTLYAEHVRHASRDRLMHAGLRSELRRYADGFPELAAEVAALERDYLK